MPPERQGLNSVWMPAWLNLPNLFTLSRLVLTPFVITAILDGRHGMALALFAIAGFTDFLDGYAARRMKLATQAGAYFDPIADKCLLSGVFLALAVAKIVPGWAVAIILGRDLAILAGSCIVLLLTTVRGLPPSIWGKWSTFIQILTAVTWMARNAAPGPVLDSLSVLMLWPCLGLTIYSGLDYAWRGIRISRAH
jgi:cardiolipin synthase